MNRTIFLIDMNAYFASVEQQANPSLRGKPIVVCGRGRTVVTTASYEARKFGVKTGMNLFEAKSVCPKLISVYGDMNKYVYTTHQIHKIILEYTDLLEAFSIDECFIDLSHRCMKSDPKKIAQEIKSKIKQKLGLLCSIGIGPNKIVAKIASKLQKPDGLVEIKTEEIPEFFKKLPIENLQGVGVGRKTFVKLKNLGLNTAWELGNASLPLLMHNFGIVGYYLKNIGLGRDNAPINKYFEHEQAKSVGHSITFIKNTWEKKIVLSYLLMLCEKVAGRLKDSKMEGSTVNFFLRFGDFTHFSMQCNLKETITNSIDIYRHGLKLFEKALPLQKPVRLVGISVSGLSPQTSQQYLFKDQQKKQRFNQALYAINKQYGQFTIKPSSLLIAEKFGVKEGCGMVAKSRKKFSFGD